MRRQYRLIWISAVCAMPRQYTEIADHRTTFHAGCASLQINSHHRKSKLPVATVMPNFQTSAGCKLVTKIDKWIDWPHDA